MGQFEKNYLHELAQQSNALTAKMALLYNIEPNFLITSVGLLKNDRFAQFNSKPSVKQGQNISDETKSVVNGFT